MRLWRKNEREGENQKNEATTRLQMGWNEIKKRRLVSFTFQTRLARQDTYTMSRPDEPSRIKACKDVSTQYQLPTFYFPYLNGKKKIDPPFIHLHGRGKLESSIFVLHFDYEFFKVDPWEKQYCCWSFMTTLSFEYHFFFNLLIKFLTILFVRRLYDMLYLPASFMLDEWIVKVSERGLLRSTLTMRTRWCLVHPEQPRM